MFYFLAALLVVACILYTAAAWFFGSIIALAIGGLLARANFGKKTAR